MDPSAPKEALLRTRNEKRGCNEKQVLAELPGSAMGACSAPQKEGMGGPQGGGDGMRRTTRRIAHTVGPQA